ncbi:hypothetical protein [Oscillospiraceae bacterium]|nr:hypothetical protein [Oscillospiraceae bacterium]
MVPNITFFLVFRFFFGCYDICPYGIIVTIDYRTVNAVFLAIDI